MTHGVSVTLRLLPLPGRPLLPVPSYQTAHAAGLDLLASEGGRIEPGRWVAVPTGLGVEIPVGFEGQVRPRSGLAAKHGVTVLNAPGTIDADYRGELKVLLVNHGVSPYDYQVGDRIAQLVIAPVIRAQIELVTHLSSTERGEGGFGHTGR
ncbi:MAG: dUTP diphosphatase [Deltaproteobacteria bacterium]|nr:dUTP diphosphatase [Deltaproteobacteria bacterium]